MVTQNKTRNYSTRKLVGKNATTTGGPGPKVADQTNWRRKFKPHRIKFTDEAKQIFLEEFAKHNLMTVSSKAAGVTTQCVRNHLENDGDFMQAFQACKLMYRDRVVGHAQKLMFDGMQEPIVGGKNRDEIIGYKVTYPINLIAMELRKVDPEYLDRSEVEHRGGGSSVLVVPAEMKAEDWLKRATSQEHTPSQDTGQEG